MGDDLLFRIVLFALLLVDLSMPGYFRRRAKAGIAAADRRCREWRRVPELVLTILAYAALLAYMLDPRTISWSQIGLPHGIRALGIAFAVLGLGGLFWAFRHLGSNLVASWAADTEPTLVTSGPYRWVRHPMYSAWALLLLGYGTMTASWAVTLLAAAAFAAVFRRTQVEESRLSATFGEAYVEYAARTGRFLPRLPRSI